MKNKQILLLFFILLAFAKHTVAQNRDIDSLVNQLTYMPNDTNKVNLLYEIVLGYNHLSELDSAEKFAIKSIELSEKLNYQKGKQMSSLRCAYINHRKSFYVKAIYHANISLEICRGRKDSVHEAECLNILGLSYTSTGEYNKSLKLYFEALQIWDSLENKSEHAIVLNNIGLVNYYLEKYKTALEYYEASFEICEEIDYTKGKSLFYNNCGLLFHKQKQYEKALDYYRKCLKIVLQQNDLNYAIPTCYSNIGNIYRDRKEYTKALEYYDKSYQICKEYADIFGIARVYLKIAKINYLQNNYSKANEYSIKSLDKSTEINALNITKEAYKQLSESYFMQKDYLNAYENHKLYKNANDSIFSIENNKQILELQTKYETEKKEIENILLKEKHKINEEIMAREKVEINNQYLIIFIIIIILTFVSTATYSLYRSNKKKKKTNFKLTSHNIEISKQKEKIESQQSQLKESEELLKQQNIQLQESNATKDRFFSIIAHDLKSPFNSIIGFSDLLQEQIGKKDYDGIEKYAGIIEQSSNRAMDLLVNLMEWSRSQTGRMEFNPEYFEMISLINEVALLFEDIAGQKKISINTNKLPANALVFADKAMISTVLRNLVSNAIKYTNKGGCVTISSKINENSKFSEISVSDTGIGIPKEKIDDLFCIDKVISTKGTENETGTGLGLILSKEFVEKHNGKIWVESVIGKGSSFNFLIPIMAINSDNK